MSGVGVDFDVFPSESNQFGINVNADNLLRVEITSNAKCHMPRIASYIEDIFIFKPFASK